MSVIERDLPEGVVRLKVLVALTFKKLDTEGVVTVEDDVS